MSARKYSVLKKRKRDKLKNAINVLLVQRETVPCVCLSAGHVSKDLCANLRILDVMLLGVDHHSCAVVRQRLLFSCLRPIGRLRELGSTSCTDQRSRLRLECVCLRQR